MCWHDLFNISKSGKQLVFASCWLEPASKAITRFIFFSAALIFSFKLVSGSVDEDLLGGVATVRSTLFGFWFRSIWLVCKRGSGLAAVPLALHVFFVSGFAAKVLFVLFKLNFGCGCGFFGYCGIDEDDESRFSGRVGHDSCFDCDRDFSLVSKCICGCGCRLEVCCCVLFSSASSCSSKYRTRFFCPAERWLAEPLSCACRLAATAMVKMNLDGCVFVKMCFRSFWADVVARTTPAFECIVL